MALQKHSCHQGQSKVPSLTKTLWVLPDATGGKCASHRKNLRSTRSRVVPLLFGRQFSLAAQQSPLVGEFVGLRIALHFPTAPTVKVLRVIYLYFMSPMLARESRRIRVVRLPCPW